MAILEGITNPLWCYLLVFAAVAASGYVVYLGDYSWLLVTVYGAAVFTAIGILEGRVHRILNNASANVIHENAEAEQQRRLETGGYDVLT